MKKEEMAKSTKGEREEERKESQSGKM